MVYPNEYSGSVPLDSEDDSDDEADEARKRREEEQERRRRNESGETETDTIADGPRRREGATGQRPRVTARPVEADPELLREGNIREQDRRAREYRYSDYNRFVQNAQAITFALTGDRERALRITDRTSAEAQLEDLRGATAFQPGVSREDRVQGFITGLGLNYERASDRNLATNIRLVPWDQGAETDRVLRNLVGDDRYRRGRDHEGQLVEAIERYNRDLQLGYITRAAEQESLTDALADLYQVGYRDRFQIGRDDQGERYLQVGEGQWVRVPSERYISEQDFVDQAPEFARQRGFGGALDERNLIQSFATPFQGQQFTDEDIVIGYPESGIGFRLPSSDYLPLRPTNDNVSSVINVASLLLGGGVVANVARRQGLRAGAGLAGRLTAGETIEELSQEGAFTVGRTLYQYNPQLGAVVMLAADIWDFEPPVGSAARRVRDLARDEYRTRHRDPRLPTVEAEAFARQSVPIVEEFQQRIDALAREAAGARRENPTGFGRTWYDLYTQYRQEISNLDAGLTAAEAARLLGRRAIVEEEPTPTVEQTQSTGQSTTPTRERGQGQGQERTRTEPTVPERQRERGRTEALVPLAERVRERGRGSAIVPARERIREGVQARVQPRGQAVVTTPVRERSRVEARAVTPTRTQAREQSRARARTRVRTRFDDEGSNAELPRSEGSGNHPRVIRYSDEDSTVTADLETGDVSEPRANPGGSVGQQVLVRQPRRPRFREAQLRGRVRRALDQDVYQYITRALGMRPESFGVRGYDRFKGRRA